MPDFSFAAEKPAEGGFGRIDIFLLLSVILLWGLGLFALYTCSADYAHRMFGDAFYFVKRQLVSSAVGFAGLLFFAGIKMSVLRKFLPYFVLGTLVLCLMTFLPVIGSTRNGAHRWIVIPIMGSFQPSELAKFAVVLFLANFFDKQSRIPREEDRVILPAIIGLSVIVLIVLLQKDFSTAFFIMLVGLFIFFIAGTGMGWFIPFCLLAVPAVILFIFKEPFRVQRLIAFMSPDYSRMGWNYQALASQRAISAGGFWGTGAGTGLMYSSRIPEVHADYIFAGWAESMGFIGVIGYFALLCFFAYRGFYLSVRTEDRFISIAGLGCTALILFQSMINCGVVCGAFPSTGIPLPFFSAGGSSLLATMCVCGFLINISKQSLGSEDEI